MILTPPYPSERTKPAPHVVVAGGGITGLSAAWELQQHAGSAVRVTVIEATSRWGGKVQTDAFEIPGAGAFTVDAGPESFVTRKPEAWELAQALGLADQLISPGSETRGMYVLHHGRPQPVPLGPVAFVRSPLLTARGKLRLLAEPFVPAPAAGGDESLASFVARRLGREALEAFVGPILAGIYNADPEHQSLLATAPVMRALEREHGSLVAGALARAARPRRSANGARPPRFFSFANGAQALIDRLVERLQARLLLHTAVEHIVAQGEKFAVLLTGGVRLVADAVILATPASTAALLLKQAAPEAAALLGRIRYNSIGTVSLAVRASDLPAGLKVRGLMVPRRAGRAIDAVTFTSAKLPTRAPEGHALLRVFFGAGDPSLVTLDDERLLAVVSRELRDLLGLNVPILSYRAYRWPNGFPQAAVGHLEQVEAIERCLPPRLLLAGSAYHGVGVPDCIRQGSQAARQVLALLMTPVLA